MDKKFKIVQCGMGPIGVKTTRMLSDRKSIEIVGAMDIDPEKIGKDIGKLAGMGSIGVSIVDSIDKTPKDADAVILTTSSSLEVCEPQILEIVERGLNIVSTCEELSYPWVTQPKISRRIDEAAKKNNVSTLGTGVNPGFLMDTLPSIVSGICKSVGKVWVDRIQDAQYRRIPFQKKIGAGLSTEEFQQRVDNKTLRHVGLTESMHMIAAALGWTLDKTEDIIDPILAKEKVVTKDLAIEPGQARGVNQHGHGYKNGEEVITMIFRAAVAEPDPCDRVRFEGEPPLEIVFPNGVNGDIATCAITINAIRSVVNAKPGLRTMLDIPAATCWT